MSENLYDALLILTGALPVALAWGLSSWTAHVRESTNALPRRHAPSQYTPKPSPLGAAWRVK